MAIVVVVVVVLCIAGLIIRSRGRSQEAVTTAAPEAGGRRGAALKEGRAALAAKNWTAAKTAFEQVLREDASDSGAKEGLKEVAYGEAMDAFRKQAGATSESGFAEAETALRRALIAKPEDAVAKQELASFLERRATSAYSAAMIEAQDQVLRSVEFVKAGKLAELQVSRKKAEEAYKRALQAKPGDAEATQGLEELPALCMTPEELYAKTTADAQKAVAAQDWAAAETCFKRALEAKPGDGPAKEGLARATYERAMADGRKALAEKKAAEAETAFTRALEAKPGDPAATQGLEQAVPAEERYRRAMEQGRRGAAAGDLAAAEAAFKTALQIKPQDGDAAKELTKIQAGGLKVKAAALVSAIRAAVDLAKQANAKGGAEDKRTPQEKTAATDAALAKKKALEAQIQKVNKTLQRTKAVAAREKLIAEIGGLQKQVTAIEEALKQEEDLAKGRQTIADARKQLDALQAEYKADAAALKEYRDAISAALRELPCPAADRQYRFAENYLGLKETDKAKEAFQKLIADFPDSEAAEKARKALEGLK